MQIGTVTFTSDGLTSMSVALGNNNPVFRTVDHRQYKQDRSQTVSVSASISVDGPQAETEAAAVETWYSTDGNTFWSFRDPYTTSWTGVGNVTTRPNPNKSWQVDLSLDSNFSSSGSMPDLSEFGHTTIRRISDFNGVVTTNKNGAKRLSSGCDPYFDYAVNFPFHTQAEMLQILGYFHANFNATVTMETNQGTLSGTLSNTGITFNFITSGDDGEYWSCSEILVERATLT